jgi:AraC-like DNA-binding protein
MGNESGTFSVKAENHSVNEDAHYSVRSRFYTPPPQFNGCFTTFYQLALDCEEGGTLHDFLQPEWGNIRFFGNAAPRAQIGESLVENARFNATGPSSLPCEFELGTTRMWGIGFLPLGWARFVDADARDLTNTVCDGASHPVFQKFDCLSEVLCDPSVPTEEQLAFLTETLERLMQPNRDESKITRIHTALVGGEHIVVGDLAAECGMSIRTLERMCHRYFGFSPKLLLRRQRFMRSLTSFMLHQGARWTEAMDGEYHDQAQFTREFTQFMTMTPSKYAALDHPILASFMEARARVWGSAAQTLDEPSRFDEL